MKNLILASASPRRREILNTLNIPFSIQTSSFDESSVTDVSPITRAIKLARLKAVTVKNLIPSSTSVLNSVILAADTLVFTETNIFGKPKNEIEAYSMLCSYSLSHHNVVTALCLYDGASNTLHEKHNVSCVYFKKLSEDDILNYLKTGEWKDAAGAYKIQGRASFFISKIEGSYSSIVGLPISELHDLLKECELPIF